MCRTVTVGLDGSPESLAAAEWAADEAWPHAIPLRLRWARLDESPVAALAGAARGADLLVLGSRGLGRTTGFLLGSVASSVLTRAERPVVIVRAAAGPRPDGAGTAWQPGAQRDVVLGLDLCDRQAETVLDFAFDTAARHRVALRVVHGWNPSTLQDAGPDDEQPVRRAVILAEALRPWREKYPQVKVAEEAMVGTAGSHLVDVSHDAGLVVVGRRRRSAQLGPHIGPVTHHVLREAVPPVAVVPHD